jgi:uncharacterized membrane protein YccC
VIASSLRPGPHALVILVLVFAWVCYAVLNVNYALFAAGVTSYVVFLLALAGLPETAIIRHRAVNTLAGGALALLFHALFAFIARRREGATSNTRRSEADGKA